MVCPCGNSALPPSSFKDGFLSLIRPPSPSLFCFKISSKKEVGEKSAQGKDGKAVSLLNLLFSHRPIWRGTAGLSQPRSRVLKRRNDQGRVSLINISLQLRFDCVSKLPVAHHLMNKNWKYDPCISWWGQESAFIFTFLKKLQAPLLEKLFVRVIYTRNLLLKHRSLCTRDCFMETARTIFNHEYRKTKKRPRWTSEPLLLIITIWLRLSSQRPLVAERERTLGTKLKRENETKLHFRANKILRVCSVSMFL